jgi:SM-20-related protein
LIQVFDNVLSNETALSLEKEILNADWKSHWNYGKLAETSWNWHQATGNDIRNMGENSTDTESLTPNLQILWETVSKKILEVNPVKHKMERFYMNAHTYGQDGYIHTDDGSITAIYYPFKWDVSHEGGTSFYNEEQDDCIFYCSNKFNRLILFDAKIPHRAMPMTRDCYKLRSVVVFKTSMDVNDSSYFDWYYAK